MELKSALGTWFMLVYSFRCYTMLISITILTSMIISITVTIDKVQLPPASNHERPPAIVRLPAQTELHSTTGKLKMQNSPSLLFVLGQSRPTAGKA